MSDLNAIMNEFGEIIEITSGEEFTSKLTLEETVEYLSAINEMAEAVSKYNNLAKEIIIKHSCDELKPSSFLFKL